MFYKPKFCCDCGEKIERVDWRLWNSRRFCELCETQQKAHELLPRVIVGLGFLGGVFGFGSYLQQGSHVPSTTQTAANGIKASKKNVISEVNRKVAVSESNIVTGANSEISGQGETKIEPSGERRFSNSETGKQLENKKNSSDEPVYFCGAATKKGTPCSRRVRVKGRCWQHGGKTGAVKVENPRSSELN